MSTLPTREWFSNPQNSDMWRDAERLVLAAYFSGLLQTAQEFRDSLDMKNLRVLFDEVMAVFDLDELGLEFTDWEAFKDDLMSCVDAALGDSQ